MRSERPRAKMPTETNHHNFSTPFSSQQAGGGPDLLYVILSDAGGRCSSQWCLRDVDSTRVRIPNNKQHPARSLSTLPPSFLGLPHPYARAGVTHVQEASLPLGHFIDCLHYCLGPSPPRPCPPCRVVLLFAPRSPSQKRQRGSKWGDKIGRGGVQKPWGPDFDEALTT